MLSQGILRTDSTDSTSKKSNRIFYVLGFVEFIFISICLLLLLLNQYLSNIVDDYSTAYTKPDDDDWTPYSTATFLPPTNSPTTNPTINPNTTSSLTTENPTTKTSTTTTTNSTFQEKLKVFIPKSSRTKTPPAGRPENKKSVMMPIPKKNLVMDAMNLHPTSGIRNARVSGTAETLNNYSKANDSDLHEGNFKWRIDQKAKESYLTTDEPMVGLVTESLTDGPKTATNLNPQPKEDWIEVFIRNLVPESASFKIKRNRNSEDNRKKHKMQTKLSNLLIMYPCCIAAIILLWMQLISRLANDIEFKSTMVLFSATSIALGIIIFAVSVAESVNYGNYITILIAVSSAIFILLQVIGLILMFTAM